MSGDFLKCRKGLQRVNNLEHCVTDDDGGSTEGDNHHDDEEEEEGDENNNTGTSSPESVASLASVITLNLSFMPLLRKKRKYLIQSGVLEQKPLSDYVFQRQHPKHILVLTEGNKL